MAKFRGIGGILKYESKFEIILRLWIRLRISKFMSKLKLFTTKLV